MPSKLQSIVLGSVVVAVLSTSYIGFINFLCCAGVIIGAIVTVWHYTSTHGVSVPPGQGAVMGLAAAALGAFLSIFTNYLMILLDVRHDLFFTDFMLESFGDQMPPAQRDELEAARDAEPTLSGQFTNGLIGVAVSAVFGAIGGAIGASIFKSKGNA